MRLQQPHGATDDLVFLPATGCQNQLARTAEVARIDSDHAFIDRMVDDVAICIDEAAEHIAHRAGGLQRGQLVALQQEILRHGGEGRKVADAQDCEIEAGRAAEDFLNAGMRQQRLPRAGIRREDRCCHQIAFGVQPVRQAPCEFRRIGTADAGEAPKHRQNADAGLLAIFDARQAGAQRLAPAQADRGILRNVFADVSAQNGPDDFLRRIGILWLGDDDGAFKPVSGFERPFQRDAIAQLGGDPDLNHAALARIGEDAQHAGAAQAQGFRDLVLGHALHVIEPCDLGLEVIAHIGLVHALHAALPYLSNKGC